MGFFIRDNIDFKVLPQPCVNTFESISIHLSMGNTQDIIFHTLYRPPNVSKADFIGEFSTFVECAALTCCENIILGDLNLHLDKQDVWSQKFSDSLCQCNFTQISDSPTHIHGHILRRFTCQGCLCRGSSPESHRGDLQPSCHHFLC